MCNNYANHVSIDDYREAFSELQIPIEFPQSLPNLEPRDEIRPTDVAPVIRMAETGPELVQLSWGFPPARQKGPPVINFRSEGRRFGNGRCLVPASWFYEYTGARYPKTKWRFAKSGESWFCIAGLWRPAGDGGVAFTMLTAAPGPDVAPYHDRQVVVLERCDWAAWLGGEEGAERLLAPSPAGTFTVEQASERSESRLL